VGALCAFILLALSIAVYSPLHQDDPQSGGVCPFCHFQGLGCELAAGQIQIDIPLPRHVVPDCEDRHQPSPIL
jgi:hypothetical protein